MKNIYEENKNIIKEKLEMIWNYMKLQEPLEKCDIIIGCGCASLDIPVKCADLLKKGYGKKIIFAGGKGKITKDNFQKSESEIYKEIALKQGIKEEDILIENKSTNTGDNFKFALKIIENNNLKADKILIVHKPMNERRTLATARALIKDKQLFITSTDMSFEEYFEILNSKSYEDIFKEISVIIGDIQRLIIYPQFGWLVEMEVPDKVKECYFTLKELGFNKYIISKEEIKKLIMENDVDKNKSCYFN